MEAKLITVPPATVDDFGDVVALRDAFAPTEKRYQALRAQLAALAATGDPAAEFVVKGSRYTLRISACGMESTLDVPAVRKRLGAALFLECARVTKKALEGVLLKPEIELLCVATQTGPRSYSPTPIKT